jgi:hypothetical protein
MNKKDKELYGDLTEQFRPTLGSLLFNFLYYRFLEIKRGKESIYIENAKFRLPTSSMPYQDLKYLAIIKNKKVIEIIRLNEETANIILGGRISFVSFDPTKEKVAKGTEYIDKTFINKEDND